jgi:hypothetical protein
VGSKGTRAECGVSRLTCVRARRNRYARRGLDMIAPVAEALEQITSDGRM